MSPDPTDANPASLPRSFRGYNRQATEELFRRVAWDYGVLAGEHRKLKKTIEDMHPPARRKGDLDGEAHLLFAAAQKAAREMRESARAECEQALRKAKGRAAEIEDEANRAATESAAVLKAAAALRSTLQEALRRLESGESPPSPVPVRSTGSEGDSNGAGAAAEPLDLAPGKTPGSLPDGVTPADTSRVAMDDPADPTH